MVSSRTRIIKACTKLQLLLGEGSSAFLHGKFEPFSRYLATGDTWRSATPSSCSPTPTLPTLPRAALAVLKPCLTGVCCFQDFMPSRRLAIYVFLQSLAGSLPRWTLRSTIVSIACEPQERVGTFSREAGNAFSRFVRHRAHWLGWHRAGPRAVNMRAVDAATFNNVVIESIFFFFSTIGSDI